MEERSIYSIDGLAGFLMASLLLIFLEIALMTMTILAQRSNSDVFYTVEKEKLKPIDKNNYKHYKIVKRLEE